MPSPAPRPDPARPDRAKTGPAGPDPARTRQPVRWSTHSQLIALIVVAVLGGTMFGLAFAVWPQSGFERVLGSLILLGVVVLLGWVVAYLRRPVAGPQRPHGGRRPPPRR